MQFIELYSQVSDSNSEQITDQTSTTVVQPIGVQVLAPTNHLAITP